MSGLTFLFVNVQPPRVYLHVGNKTWQIGDAAVVYPSDGAMPETDRQGRVTWHWQSETHMVRQIVDVYGHTIVICGHEVRDLDRLTDWLVGHVWAIKRRAI